MLEFLKGVVPILGALIGIVIGLVFFREADRTLRRWRVRRQCARCLAQVRRIATLPSDALMAFASQLKRAFSPAILESVLDEYRTTTQTKGWTPEFAHTLSAFYDHLGLVEKLLIALRQEKSWIDRAAAADKLGHIGHPRAVLPLIAVLQHPDEDKEVKRLVIRALGRIRDERAIAPLLEGLGRAETATGQLLADVLVQFGPAAVAPLTHLLHTSPKETPRGWVAKILGLIGDPRAVATLLQTLSDHSYRVRLEAAAALGKLRAEEAVTPLSQMVLTDPVELVRDAAAQALGEIGDPRAQSILLEALEDASSDVRQRAMSAMERMGESAVPFFLEALRSPAPEAVRQAATALERLGVVTQQIERLAGTHADEAIGLLRAVARSGVVETLVRSIAHPAFTVRIRLCRILQEAANTRTLEALTALAQKDTEWAARLEALKALVRIADPRSAPILRKALETEAEPVREQLLEHLRDTPRTLLEPLHDTVMRTLHDGNVQIRLAATRVVRRHRHPTALAALITALGDVSAAVRAEAAAALGDFAEEGARPGPAEATQVVDAIVTLLRDPEIPVRLAAVVALGRWHDPRTIGALAAAFAWSDEGNRDQIAAALAAMPHGEFVRVLDTLMGFGSAKARAGVAWTLGLIGEPSGLRLLPVLLRDPEPIVRAAAAGAIGHCGTTIDTTSFGPPLIDLLADPNARVRAAAINALAHLGNGNALQPLYRHLTQEPDPYTCRCLLLAIGTIALADVPPTLRAEALATVKHWGELTTDGTCRLATLVASLLLGDPEGPTALFRAWLAPKERPVLQTLVRALPQRIHDRLFTQLTVPAALFWQERGSQQQLVAHLIGELQSSREAEVRRRAIRLLMVTAGKEQSAAVETAFEKDPQPTVRAEAFRALAQCLNGEQLLTRIYRAVQDPADAVRSEIVPILRTISPRELTEGRAQLIPLLDSAVPDIRESVAQLLAQLFQHDWSLLADQLLGSPRRNRLLGLIETLGRIGAPKTVSLFLQLLKHRDPLVRGAAARWAGEVSSLSGEELLPYLEDPDETVRAAVVTGLGRYLNAARLGTLFPRAQDPAVIVRSALVKMLGQQRPSDDGRLVPIVERLCHDPDPAVRCHALVARIRLGGSGMAARVIAALEDWSPDERQMLANAMEQEGIVLILSDQLRTDRNAGTRCEALEVLAAIDGARFVSLLAESLRDPAVEVRLAAVVRLGSVDDPEIQQRIDALAADPVDEVRQAVKSRRLRRIK